MDTSRVLSCDRCRHRKIKCDKQTPCSNCRASSKPCSTTAPKSFEPRQRVLISTQYERKIDRIEEKLANLESTLESIAASLKAANCSRESEAPPTVANTLVDRSKPQHDDPESEADTSDSNDDPPHYEGESSMTAHSAQASEYASAAVGNSPDAQSMSTALSTLKSLVSRQTVADAPRRPLRFRPKEKRIDHSTALSRLPSREIVLKILRQRDTKTGCDAIFDLLYLYSEIGKFRELLKDVYFDPTACSGITAVLIHSGLYYLFLEARACAQDTAGSQAADPVMVANMELCKENFELSLDSLELLLPATDESICALAMGAVHAIDCSKPALSWSLTLTASSLAQSLGYHRSDSHHANSAVRHRRAYVWWVLYGLDKTLSLRLGRASTIQEYDITVGFVGYPTPKGDTTDKIWTEVMSCWMTFASVQGRIYEKLYSPAALAASVEDRAAHATNLAIAVESVQLANSRIHIDGIDSDRGRYYAAGGVETDKISHLVALTLIHRATSPSSQPTAKCIEYARLAMDAHQKTYAKYHIADPDMWEAYLQWTVIHAPFAPFTVLFCHVIASSDRHDLRRLGDFADTLHSKLAKGEATSKFRRICQTFYQLAVQYVEAKARGASFSQPDDQAQLERKNPFGGSSYPEGNAMEHGVSWAEFNMADSVPVSEFDQYFAALGFAPRQDTGAGRQGTDSAGVDGAAATSAARAVTGPECQPAYDATGLGNWYQGNQYMFDLLEQDLSYLDTMQM